MDIESLIPLHIREMRPYVPTPSPDVMAQRLGLRAQDIIKLDANENHWPPSPRVREAMERAPANFYPDPDQNALREALSAYVGVPKENILCGAGGDEILDLIGRLLIRPGDGVVDTPPTFGVFKAVADMLHARYVPAMRRSDFSLDVDAIERAVRENERVKILYLVNPNNPDGSVFDDEVLKRLLQLPTIILLDEAYIEFSAQRSRATWVMEHDNLIVARTFSKAAGLAGLRVGYGIFPSRVIAHMWKIKPYFSPSVMAQIGAVAALSDLEHMREIARHITAERNRMGEMLSELGWIHPLPSQTNFLLCRVDERVMPARDVKLALEKRGILFRHFDRDGLRDCIRISVGLPEHTDALVNALHALRLT